MFDLSNEGKTWNEGKSSGEAEKSKRDEALTFVTQIFTGHLITSPYQSKSGGRSQGWPTFASDSEKIQEIGRNATTLVHHYKALQEEHSYQKTSGYRSRASSGAMESMKEQILTPVIEFIRENFRLKDNRFEGLVKQLNELDLSGKKDEEFNAEVLEKIKEYCEDDRIPKQQLTELGKFLLPSQTQQQAGGGRK